MVGHTPLLPQNWSYDPEAHRLSFHQGQGDSHLSGVLYLLGSGIRMKGYVQIASRVLQVSAALAPVYYDCRLAKDAVDKAGTNSVELKWDTESSEWKNAPWSPSPFFRFS
jgi:hypothetical protein